MHGATSAKRHVVVNSAAKITQHMQGALRDVLRAAVTSTLAADGGTGSIQVRACAVLYLLRNNHPLDRRGRCRSCRRSGAVLGQRRRTCRIHLEASFWLRQPNDVVLCHLTSELNHRPAPAPGTGGRPDRCDPAQAAAPHDLDATEVLPGIPGNPCTRTSSLIVPGEGLVERRVHGSALDVLNEVLTWETGSRQTHVVDNS